LAKFYPTGESYVYTGLTCGVLKIMMPFFLFILGACVGSFLNVVGLRWDLPAGRQALKNFGGRSACPHCGKTLKWLELIPILSFLIQRGRCRGCGTKISWQYPVIEIWTGLIFATIPIWALPVFCIYVVITIYDFKHKIIPDALVYSSILLSVVGRWLSVSSTLDWLAGPILFSFFASIWLLSRGRAMGFGDAKLGLSVGLLLGATLGFSAIVLAFWIGAFVSLLYIFLGKIGLPAGKAGFLKNDNGLTMKSEIPFAPFIIIGAWVSLVLNLNLLHVTSF